MLPVVGDVLRRAARLGPADPLLRTVSADGVPARQRATLAAPTLLDLLMTEPGIAGTDLSALRVVFTGGQTVAAPSCAGSP